MRTRTRLTTPPGEEPVGEDDVRVRDPERYSPALTLPREPRVPGRYRRLGVTLAVIVVVAALAYIGFQLANAGQFQDPSLDEEPGVEQPAIGEDPAIEQPAGEATTPAG